MVDIAALQFAGPSSLVMKLYLPLLLLLLLLIFIFFIYLFIYLLFIYFIIYLFIYFFFFWHYHVVDVSALQFVGPSSLMPINIHFLFHFDGFVNHFTYFSTILLIIEVTLTNIFF